MVPDDDPTPPPTSSVLDRHAGAGSEIERKFLVAAMPEDLARHPSERISQGYLAIDAEAGTEVRLRRRGFHTLLTVKQGSGLSRAEEEFVIDSPRFERLWAATKGRRIEKLRHRVPVATEGAQTVTAEVDVFSGALSGLVLVEVEFGSVEAAEAFRPPGWMRPEVTGDPRYGNARLAIDGAPERRTVGEHALLDGESVEAGVRHVALAQIDAAADALQGRDAQEYGKAVHTARKAFKRARAVVRIAQDGLGEEASAHANATLRDAGRRLAGARDALVVVETLDALGQRYPDELDAQVTAGLRAALHADWEEADREARADEGASVEVLADLTALRSEVAEWQLGDDPAASLAAGLERIARHARKRLKLVHADGKAAEGYDTDLLHELRKRAKDLWHAAELLEIAAPKRFRALASAAHDLADHIGDDHDLAVLAEQVRGRPDAFTRPEHAERVLEAIARRRAKLQRKAIRGADALIASKPGRLADRVIELGER